MNIFEKIYQLASDKYEYQVYQDLYVLAKEENNIEYMLKLAHLCEQFLPTLANDNDVVDLWNLHKECLKVLAPYDFESYLLLVEWDREPKKKFYPPRRKVLKTVVEDLQALADDKLDLLAISLPPRELARQL